MTPLFRRILIANRGEIACRVIAACRRLGISPVVAYSDADRGARHVALADAGVRLPGFAAAETYLRADLILAAAKALGAEAIHPGYGFLSENPDFVEAVSAAGLVFIGPSASAIRAMGLKDAAKDLMARAGVPVVPGWQGKDQSPDVIAAAAEQIGYPVLIKAVAGGGGKGMRRVDQPEDFAQALSSAQAEARAAFGNAAVLVEKYIQRPRHIEMQIFGDGTRAVHLFERDCSLQRRHQKVIEEAPAPGMSQEMRAAMGAAAVRAAEAIGYAGAGTVEFIADASDGLRPDRFWFMEMNTRLQVEHPVTEEVTGIDLVEWQIRVAAGEALPLGQEQISLRGHAFEARLYAEDVAAGFLPATGTLAHLAFPAFARIETGVSSGDTISTWYDPMIAKIITHGPTREIALARLRSALAETEVAGSVTNLGFLARLTAAADVETGKLDTGLIERGAESLTAAPVPSPEIIASAALAALGLDQPGDDLQGFALWAPLRHQISLISQGETLDVSVEVLGPEDRRVELAGQVIELTWRGGWSSGAEVLPKALRHASGVTVFAFGGLDFALPDPFAVRADEAGQDIARAPMPGLLREILVAAGSSVRKGQPLARLEAMKMEHPLIASRGGVVAEILAQEGALVEAGAPIVRLDPLPEP